MIEKQREWQGQIITSALEQLKAVYPVRVINLRQEANEQDGFHWDGEVTLKTELGSSHYFFEVKKNLRPETVRHLLLLKELDRKHWTKTKEFLLLADYVNPSLGHQLQEARVYFIDAAGNMFLKQEPGLHLYVEGKRLQVVDEEKPARLFQPSGLMMLYGLLVDPESVNQPYRQLAERNGVALGTVGWIMRDLKMNGYLEPIGKRRFRLNRNKDLFDHWVQGYGSRLRPKILLGEFTHDSRDLFTHTTRGLDDVVEDLQNSARQRHINWALSGGFGALELLSPYRFDQLRAYRRLALSVFVERWDDASLVDLGIMRVKAGPISVLKGFSPRVFEMWDKSKRAHPVVHPFLIYAELIHGGTDRDLETARRIYNDFVEPSIAKD